MPKRESGGMHAHEPPHESECGATKHHATHLTHGMITGVETLSKRNILHDPETNPPPAPIHEMVVRIGSPRRLKKKTTHIEPNWRMEYVVNKHIDISPFFRPFSYGTLPKFDLARKLGNMGTFRPPPENATRTPTTHT